MWQGGVNKISPYATKSPKGVVQQNIMNHRIPMSTVNKNHIVSRNSWTFPYLQFSDFAGFLVFVNKMQYIFNNCVYCKLAWSLSWSSDWSSHRVSLLALFISGVAISLAALKVDFLQRSQKILNQTLFCERKNLLPSLSGENCPILDNRINLVLSGWFWGG